jgi:hypothetical protein
MLVTPKVKVNFNLPAKIAGLLDEYAKEVNGKQKWLVSSAAILLLAEASASLRSALYKRLAATDLDGDSGGAYEALIEEAKSGKLRAGQIKMGATSGTSATTTATRSHSSENTPKSSQERGVRYVQRDAEGRFGGSEQPEPSRERKRKPRG